MSDIDLSDVVAGTRYVLAESRGFDDDCGWLNPAVWERAAGRPEVATAEILAAVTDVTGFYSRATVLDPSSDRDRDTLRWVASELEKAAAALRGTVNNHAAGGDES